MTKSDSRFNFVSRIRAFQREDTAHCRNSVRCRSCQNIIPPLHHIASKFTNFRICSANVGAIRDLAEKLESRAVDIIYVQAIIKIIKYVKIIKGKTAKYMLFWRGNDTSLRGVETSQVNNVNRVTHSFSMHPFCTSGKTFPDVFRGQRKGAFGQVC